MLNTDIDGTQINECTKWHGDGFKCVVADDCVDGYFDNSGGVPAIRGDDDDYVDVDEVSYHILIEMGSFKSKLRLKLVMIN